MSKWLAGIGVAMLCLLALPSGAGADRAATRAEHAAIAELAGSFPPRCIAARISTVDRRWGIFYSRGLQSCPGADGFVLVRKVDGYWEQVTSAGGTDQDLCSAVFPGIPPRVGADLGICMLPANCSTLRVDGVNLPVRVARGRLSCRTARAVVRRYFPLRGRGDQTPVVNGRRWYCANSHGAELERGGVAHCSSDWYRIMVRQPGRG